ncbi:MAG: aldo/keto reductase [Alphaproteobacteria bacterium]|nr:aldo/keto reductase [Alphaproteobacteria bacterium]
MKYVTLNTDYKMPVIGLGTWKSAEEKTYQAVRWAIKAGYQHVDCAAVYGNEETVGQALHDAVAEGDIERKNLFVTSKLWNTAHKPADVRPALEQSLKDLQTDYLDLYLIHWPIAEDPLSGEALDIPQEETWAEMEKAQKDGLVRSIGVSNFTQTKLKDLMDKAEIMPAVNQVEIHPYLAQNDLVEFCRANQIVVTAYAPLGSGDRPDTMKEAGEPSLLADQVVADIAKKNSATPAQVLIAWGLARGLVEIPKSVQFDRIEENLGALNVTLDDDDMKRLNAIDETFRFVTGKNLTGADHVFDD